MSDYPSTPNYGASYGARDQTNPPYLPPTYPNQHTGHMAANYDASMAAYGYNGSIPSFGAAAVASGVPPLPIYQGWNQDAMPLPPYTTPHNHNTAQYTGYGGSSQSSSQYYQPIGQQNYQQHTGVVKPFDQTDLSEGEFEEAGASMNTPSVGFESTQFRGNDGTGYMDTAQRAVYSRAQNFSPQSGHQANYNYLNHNHSQMGRQQSGSYSPYVSPAGVDHDDQSEVIQEQTTHAHNHVQDPINGTPHNQHGWTQNMSANEHKQSYYTNGYHTPQRADSSSHEQASTQAALVQLASAANDKSISESREKAQGAILNLLPYDIRYQTYIDEGFKEDIISKLFDDLKMPRTSSKLSNGTYVQEEKSLSSNSKEHTVFLASNNQSSAVGKDNGQIGTSSLSTTKTPAVSQDVQSSSTSAQIKPTTAMSEKERSLQTKMEALRKSREERAQKAAAKTGANPVKSSQVAPAGDSEKPNSPSSPLPISKAQRSTDDDVSVNRSLQAKPAPNSSQSAAPSQSKPQVNLQQQQQPVAIPGLFLATSATVGAGNISTTPSSMSQSIPHPPTQINPRKRPVAADFDDPLPVVSQPKRPFGYSSHNEQVVIDCTDDEDEEMDLDSQADEDSPVQSARKQSIPSANPPIRKTFTSPSTSSTNTPPMSYAASKGRPDHLLQRTESEIEELKKKIAEAEARKKAKQTPTRNGTPTSGVISIGPGPISNSRSSETNGLEAKGNNLASNNLGSKVAASIAIADNQVNLERQKLAEAQADEIEKAAELKRSEAEQKRVRREQIENRKHLNDAEVRRRQAAWEQSRAEAAQREAAYQESLEERRRLEKDLQLLASEAEDQLQQQKNELESPTNQESESSKGTITTQPLSKKAGIVGEELEQLRLDAGEALKDKTGQNDSSRPASSSAAEEPSLLSQSTHNVEEPNKTRFLPPRSTRPIFGQASVPTPNGDMDPAMNGDDTEAQANSAAQPINTDAEQPCVENATPRPVEEIRDDSNDSGATNNALEAALQEAVRAEADSHSHEDEGDEMDMGFDASRTAPDPSQLAPDEDMDVVEEETRSPSYSPVLHRTAPEAVEREEEEYEPPEATPPVEVAESPPFSPAPPEPIHELADFSMEDVNSMQDTDEGGEITTEESPPILDGRVPLQNSATEDPDKIPLFTPYESPLKQFRAYRFHPEYTSGVRGGLKSLTYTHNIDANKELCRYELAGGICNDSTCDLQHFRDIVVPDDAILTALGSPDEFTGEQKEGFIAGLRQVLQGMRARKVKDFDTIATEIVAHRAKFLGDKILPLGNITI